MIFHRRMLFSGVCSLMIINEVHLFFSMTNFLFTHDALLSFSHESQKMEEQVEDIQIEVDRGHNVFLRRQFVHHHASIKDNEEWEQESATSCNHSVHQDSGEENLFEKKILKKNIKVQHPSKKDNSLQNKMLFMSWEKICVTEI